MKGLFKFIGMLTLTAIVLLALLACYWYVRPNGTRINKSLSIETWPVVEDGMHNSGTHMVLWKNEFYMVQVSSPFVFSSGKSTLVLWRSSDGKEFTKIKEFRVEGQDVKDPKLAIIGNRLFIYVLKTVRLETRPYVTAYTWSQDGENWKPLEEIPDLEGWLFWAPHTADGKTYYASAYWFEYGKSALFRSKDGMKWDMVSTIHDGSTSKSSDRCADTDIAFLSNNQLISTQRLDYSDSLFGDEEAGTGIATAKAPYNQWTPLGLDTTTRLDSPALFTYKGRVYAVGRYNPETLPLAGYRGSLFTAKRTSIFLVTQKGLVYLTDLPSAGDTSSPGVVIKDDEAFICYYTSDPTKDWSWILGMITPSQVMISHFSMPELEELAVQTEKEYAKDNAYRMVKSGQAD